MHESHNHWCVFTGDVQPWEREAFQPILDSLAKRVDIATMEDGQFGRRRMSGVKTLWVITHNWRAAAKRASSFGSKTRVYISVLGLNARSTPLPILPFKRMLPKIAGNVTLIAHSPLNHRFLLEMEQLPREKVLAMPVANPLSVPSDETALVANPKRMLNVATFAPFAAESNLHYFLTLAHYVIHRRADIRFTVMGSGRLFYHVSRLASELDLIPRASVLETFDAREIDDADIFVYAPLRNDHFVPLQIAGSKSKPVVCTDVPGISEFVDDGHSGFVVNGDDIKGMGELILRYADDSRLRSSLGAELNRRLVSRFSGVQVGKLYEKLLTGQLPALAEQHAA